MIATAVLAAIQGWLATVLWPILVTFAGWIIAGAAAVLGFLFSPTLRKWTIGAIAILLILGLTWTNGYFACRGNAVSLPAPVSICANPAFHQIKLVGTNNRQTIAAVREHNDLGEQLGCWTNSNIR